MANHALNDDEYQWFRKMAGDYKRRTLGGRPQRRERGQVYTPTTPPVQLKMVKFNHNGGTLGADEISDAASGGAGWFEWDRDSSDQIGDVDAAGVTVLDPSTYDDASVSLNRAGLWRADLQVTFEDEVSSPPQFGDADMWTSELTTNVSGHDHNYDRWIGDDIDPVHVTVRSYEREPGDSWTSNIIGGIYLSAVDLFRIDASNYATWKFAWLINATADDFELSQNLNPYDTTGMVIEVYDLYTTLILQRVGNATS